LSGVARSDVLLHIRAREARPKVTHDVEAWADFHRRIFQSIVAAARLLRIRTRAVIGHLRQVPMLRAEIQKHGAARQIVKSKVNTGEPGPGRTAASAGTESEFAAEKVAACILRTNRETLAGCELADP